MDHLQLYGDGGTDFRPAFTYVQQLIDQGEFEKSERIIVFHRWKRNLPAEEAAL